MKFPEAQLEQAFIELLEKESMTYLRGTSVREAEGVVQEPPGSYQTANNEVLIKADLRAFLQKQYAADGITSVEVNSIIRDLQKLPASDLYESNRAIMKKVSDGFLYKREDRKKKDLYIQLIDYTNTSNNIFKIVNQLEVQGYEKRIPDLILYINGLPLVVFEFKSAIREEATIHNAFVQLTVRYKRDIPELFKYNAFS